MEQELTRLHVPMIKETRRMSRSMINGKDQTHAPSPRPPAVTSNSQCWTSIIVKHKEIAPFSSSTGKGVESHLILYCIFIYIFSYILLYSFLNLL